MQSDLEARLQDCMVRPQGKLVTYSVPGVKLDMPPGGWPWCYSSVTVEGPPRVRPVEEPIITVAEG
jgi:hypothetical protein